MAAATMITSKAYIEDAYDDAILSPEAELKAKIITLKQVLKLNVFTREKALRLHGVTEQDLQNHQDLLQ